MKIFEKSTVRNFDFGPLWKLLFVRPFRFSHVASSRPATRNTIEE
jgi:hypothetical protein